MSLYIVHAKGSRQFKFGVSTSVQKRVASYATTLVEYAYIVFPCDHSLNVEAELKRELRDRGALLSHMTSGIDSECALVGPDREHLVFAFRFLYDACFGAEPVFQPMDDTPPSEQEFPIKIANSLEIARAFVEWSGGKYAFHGPNRGWWKLEDDDTWTQLNDGDLVIARELSCGFYTHLQSVPGDKFIMNKVFEMLSGKNNVLNNLKEISFVETPLVETPRDADPRVQLWLQSRTQITNDKHDYVLRDDLARAFLNENPDTMQLAQVKKEVESYLKRKAMRYLAKTRIGYAQFSHVARGIVSL